MDRVSKAERELVRKIQKQTNADRIRAMTDEELSEFLAEERTAPSCIGKCHNDYEIYGELRTFCSDCWLEWLKEEVKEVEEVKDRD